MKRRAALSLAGGPVIGGSLVLWGCGIRLRPGVSDASAQGPGPLVPRIGATEAQAQIQAGRAVLIDVRGADSYRARHARGAQLLPLDEIEKAPAAAVAKVPAGKQPILYCT